MSDTSANMYISAMQAHGSDASSAVFVDFFDNNGGPIDEPDLFGVISQKMNCGCFYVELKVSGEEDKSITVEVRYDSSCCDSMNFLKLYRFYNFSNCGVFSSKVATRFY